MNPAFSVILFTTLSGAGYGLLAWLGGMIAFAPALMDVQTDDGLSLVRFALLCLWLGIGAALTAIGLLSSMFHLGQPLRAWRAFAQWRTSWLSREGVMALATYLPVAALIILLRAELQAGTTAASPTRWMVPWAGGIVAVLSLLTVACTAMIYASLKPIPAWRHGLVVPVYLVFALLLGLLVLACVADFHQAPVLAGAALLSLALAVMKLIYWRDIDRIVMPSREAATALEGFGKISTFERPHTEANYLTREMGFVLARKHSRKLRALALLLFAGIPLLALTFAWLLPVAAVFALWIAALSSLLGAFVERWLFFAEARHMVMLYY